MKWYDLYTDAAARYHFFATFVTMIVLSFIFGLFWGMAATIFVAICKDLLDMNEKQVPFTLLDLLYSIVGLASGAVVFSLLNR